VLSLRYWPFIILFRYISGANCLRTTTIIFWDDWGTRRKGQDSPTAIPKLFIFLLRVLYVSPITHNFTLETRLTYSVGFTGCV
jgi:hypothetical protein